MESVGETPNLLWEGEEGAVGSCWVFNLARGACGAHVEAAMARTWSVAGGGAGEGLGEPVMLG